MTNPWFKFYGGDYLADPKIKVLTDSERSCWVTLLCFANQSKDGVIEFLTEEMLMREAGVPFGTDQWNKTIGILEKLENLRMVTLSNGVVTILNWAKRQASDSYERVKKYREKQTSNVFVTDRNDRREEKREEKKRIDKSIELATELESKEVLETEEGFIAKLAYLVEKGAPENIARRELLKFKSYWTEPNAKGKPRWKGENYFELNRRLATWFSRVPEFNQPDKKVLNLDEI